jgi:hypothetical protein
VGEGAAGGAAAGGAAPSLRGAIHQLGLACSMRRRARARRGRTRLDVSGMFSVHALTVLASAARCALCARASRGCARPSLERHVTATATTATRKRRASSEPHRAAPRVARPPAAGRPFLRVFGVLVIAFGDVTATRVCS